jgi:hypothetical protein
LEADCGNNVVDASERTGGLNGLSKLTFYDLMVHHFFRSTIDSLDHIFCEKTFARLYGQTNLHRSQ